MREREIIDWIRSQSAFDPAVVPVGPGDDCAIVRVGDEDVLITTDQVLDGVHFVLAEHGPRAAGRKAMARALSDIAAMAARPIAAVATVSVPRALDSAAVRAMVEGLRAAAEPFGVALVGGDVGVWAGPLAISVTVVGRPAGVTAGVAPVLRSGARGRNALCVTGALGGAWRSRRHLDFTPRVRMAAALALQYRLRAMIDLSDGLATDLHHLCDASGVGARVEAAAIPIHPDARAGGADDAAALRAALCDGEDYELLFTMPALQARTLCARDDVPVPVARIGTITKEPGVVLVYPDGRAEPLAPAGWEHRTGEHEPDAEAEPR